MHSPDKLEQPKVLAVVVTFSRPKILMSCLEALMTQTKYGLERVHVIVNSNDEETRSILASPQWVKIVTSQFLNNEGPAGGFHEGLKTFLASDAQFVWLMDDDVVVKDNCLEVLLHASVDHEFIFPRVLTASGREVVSFGWWGVLISKRVVHQAGLPLKDLFYWAEDTEYLQNRIMRVHQIKPYRVPQAMVEHLHHRSNKRPSWYYYYCSRNTLFYRTFIAGYTWYRFRRTIYLLPNLIFSILWYEDRKWRKLMLLITGVYHGFRGKIGKLIDPAAYP